MAEPEDTPDTAMLLSALFAILTARLEDATALAVEGQARDHSSDAVRDLADRLRAAGEEVVILADVAKAVAAWGSFAIR